MHVRLPSALTGMLLLALASASPAAAAPTSVAGHARYAIDSAASTADFSQTAGRNRFVILQEWEQARRASLKAANPSLKVLMYKNLSFVASEVSGNTSTGVSTREADANPSWYLLNSAGERFPSWSYTWLVAADIGNAAYQERWADNVLAKLTAQGWDGVFVDDTNPTMRHHYDVSSVAKYPSDAAYGAATGAALATIGPKIRGAGKLVIPNFGEWRLYRSVVDGWLDHVSGGMEEMFTKWGATPGTGYLDKGGWDLQLGAQKVAEAKGKYFVGVSHSTGNDAAAARFGWATTLLGASGLSSFSLAADYANEAWFPEYDYAIGEPTGPETTEAGNVHRRVFSSGLVLVNPTAVPVLVSFGGTYSGSGLTGATQATLAPSSGLILTRDGGTTQPAPTPTSTPTTTTTTTTTTTPTPTPTTTTPVPTTPGPGKAKGRIKSGTTLRAVTQVQVSSSKSATSWSPVARKRATCPRMMRKCTVRVRVVVRRGNVVRARGVRRATVMGGGQRTISVVLRSVKHGPMLKRGGSWAGVQRVEAKDGWLVAE